MKNPFKQSGFDTLIGPGMTLKAATIIIPHGATVVIDGEVDGPEISTVTMEGKVDTKSTLVVNGRVRTYNNITVPNVVITGDVQCDLLIVEGRLAIKSGAKIKAQEVRYRGLTIEDGAVVLAQMNHLDHISLGEQV